MKLVSQLLHRSDPYEGFVADNWPLDIQGWYSDHPIFDELFSKLKPQLIIEVGTWKGASAIQMARLARKYGLDTEIVCVDTFLGWVGAPFNMRFGFPTIYWQFIANVTKAGVEDVITPFPQNSYHAAWWLKTKGIMSSLIYIDADHDTEQVYMDLLNYWPLLQVGGTVFGDDYDRSSVRRALELFTRLTGRTPIVCDEKWSIEKTSTSSDIPTLLTILEHGTARINAPMTS
jgi:hypothetical protein